MYLLKSMGNKTAFKPKAKLDSGSGKKVGRGYALVHAKSGITQGGKTKSGLTALQTKGLVTFPAAGISPPITVSSLATTAPAKPAVSPEERESRLAGRLVNEVAESSSDVNVLCATYALKREELGRLTGFSLRALADWASGDLPSQPAQRRLHEVRRLLDALSEIVKRERIPQWLHQPNPAFAPMTPLQVIELGEIDRLWAMVHDLASGQPE